MRVTAVKEPERILPRYGKVEVPAEFSKQKAFYEFGYQQGFLGHRAKRRTNFTSLESSKAFNAGFESGAALRCSERDAL